MAGAPSSRDELSAGSTIRPRPVRNGPASVVRLLLGLAALLAVAAAACEQEAVEPGVQTITQADAGTTVRLAVNEVVEVRLASNPTTGYAWHILDDDLQTDVVRVASSDYVPDETPADEPIAGSGGTEVWRFRGVRAGEATIGMDYYFGEDPGQSGGEFAFTVVVE
jgi:inhibitor of cysteine peptidase